MLLKFAYLVIGIGVGLQLLMRQQETLWEVESTLATNKIVLITGANTGLGFETARELAEAGAHVVIFCYCYQRIALPIW